MRLVKKWAKFAVGAMVMLAVTAAWCCWPSREPLYKGKAVREYIYDLATQGPTPQTEDGLRFFGTNTVPYVRAGLRAKDTWGRTALAWVAASVPGLKIRVWTARQERLAALTALLHIQRLEAWGDAKDACAPELRALTKDPDPGIRRTATFVLANMVGFDWGIR
jgi:hypothetical protein